MIHQPADIGLPELKKEATVATYSELAMAAGSKVEPMAEKARKRPRKISDAPGKTETQSSEEGLQLKKGTIDGIGRC